MFILAQSLYNLPFLSNPSSSSSNKCPQLLISFSSNLLLLPISKHFPSHVIRVRSNNLQTHREFYEIDNDNDNDEETEEDESEFPRRLRDDEEEKDFYDRDPEFTDILGTCLDDPEKARSKDDFCSDGEHSETNLNLPGYKWRLIIAYDGTRYSGFPSALFNRGWQYQKSIPTVQCIVEEALTQTTKLKRADIHFVGASRTDAGVHASGQVAHFMTPFNYENVEDIHRAINGLLPCDIRIREIRPVVPEFHARFSVESKIYFYKVYNDAIMDPFLRHYAYHSVYKLNVAAMRDAAKLFVGKHDFSAFANVSRNDRTPNPVKNILRFDVNEMGPLLQLEVEGSGFLYRQVRNMVALLLQVGREAVPVDIVPKILASLDRKELAKYALSVPPHGLCLFSIKYNEDHLQVPLGRPVTSFGRHRSISKCKLPF